MPRRKVVPEASMKQIIRDTGRYVTKIGGKLLHSKTVPLIFVFLLGLAPGFFLYMHHKDNQNTGTNSANLKTTSDVVSRVSRHILLPSGEQPTVATVTDASKVRNQAFFASAASGDKVLIYAQAKKAYLYRPSIDRIIEVAPLAPNQSGQSGQSGQ